MKNINKVFLLAFTVTMLSSFGSLVLAGGCYTHLESVSLVNQKKKNCGYSYTCALGGNCGAGVVFDKSSCDSKTGYNKKRYYCW